MLIDFVDLFFKFSFLSVFHVFDCFSGVWGVQEGGGGASYEPLKGFIGIGSLASRAIGWSSWSPPPSCTPQTPEKQSKTWKTLKKTKFERKKNQNPLKGHLRDPQGYFNWILIYFIDFVIFSLLSVFACFWLFFRCLRCAGRCGRPGWSSYSPTC